MENVLGLSGIQPASLIWSAVSDWMVLQYRLPPLTLIAVKDSIVKVF